MAVPDYQRLMMPILRIASDGKEHTFSEFVDKIAAEMRLTEEDRKELLPSGRQAKFDNRVGWAGTYLKKAGLLERTGRGKLRVTSRGLDVIKDHPGDIDSEFLTKFPEFREFKQAARPEAKEKETQSGSETPEETLEAGYQELRRELARELLDRVKKCPPNFFEQLVVDLLLAMGYGGSRKDAGKAVGQTGDGGVDGIIKEDRLGLDVVYIQAKRWESNVGRPIVQPSQAAWRVSERERAF